MITENLSTLKIHKLSQEQYDRELAAGRIDETALYLTPDEGIDLSNYKALQDSVSDPSASGQATQFIDTISQDENGKITATKKNIDLDYAVKVGVTTNTKTLTNEEKTNACTWLGALCDIDTFVIDGGTAEDV